ncbi:ROK family transcriptional regulator [Marisediminicola senii]|uniref:ROK family transcriptional regulator n=1 Tax=Marisediminicola senii TaxID=2711233 RepID=UPI0013E9F41B|nr:ROK family transcriptional regulator [Marisediminicola senii]
MKRESTRSADRTRSLVIDGIRSAGEISRVELATRTGLTEATISTVVRKAIDDGLVVEIGHGVSTGGKRRTILAVNSSARHAVGVSLARSRIALVLTDLSGEVIAVRETEGARDAHPSAVTERLAREIAHFLGAHKVDPESVVGVGIASPGPLDCAVGELRGLQPGPLWRGFALEERLENLTGLKVLLDNDATCAALGDYWTTRRDAPPPVAATVYMADGIGAGILVDGRVFHGSSSNPGELGHISLDINGPQCHCGAQGCVEVFASPSAVAAAAMRNPGLVASLELSDDPDVDRRTFEAVATAAISGNKAARGLIEASARYLGAGIVTLSNLLDLDEILLSGPGFTTAGEIYAETIHGMLQRGTFMRGIHSVTVKLSDLGVDAAAIGAATLVMQHQITPHSAINSRRVNAT